MLKGPGFGPTLLPQLITEGMATAFDQAAFPGPVNPWTHAITPAQECALWKEASPQLGYTGLYDTWMFGDKSLGIRNWTGFTIGYHIVNDYRRHHPSVSWETLTLTSATTILCGKPLPALPAMSTRRATSVPRRPRSRRQQHQGANSSLRRRSAADASPSPPPNQNAVATPCPLRVRSSGNHGHSRTRARPSHLGECRSQPAETQPSKLVMRVRFPSPAPMRNPRSATWIYRAWPPSTLSRRPVVPLTCH